MKQKKICGFDINGWRDFVTRNWTVLPGEDEVVGTKTSSQSGPLTSIVQIGHGETLRWVGGHQADMAPHGLGGGWGEVGREDRRLAVRTLLEAPEAYEQHLFSAFIGLASGAEYNVVAIDDALETTEIVQEGILSSLATGKFKNTTLVWRSVLAVLFAIDTALLEGEQMVGVISHSPDGITVQKLRLRKATGRTSEVIAPERQEMAKLVTSNIGYRSIVQNARTAAIGPKGLSAQTAHLAISKNVGRVAFGLHSQPDIMRRQNGDWDIISHKHDGMLSDLKLDKQLSSLDDCPIVLVDTLTEGNVRDALSKIVSAQTVGEVKLLPACAVAHGAFVAAKRFSEGDPVYFDFLPRLSTIVFGHDGAASFDLVDKKETLEAGRVYRSKKPALFAIPKGHSSVSVFLQKEAEPHPRKVTVNLDTPLREPVPVSLWVEQKPAAGRARILLDAPALGRQFFIDWETAVDDERSWDEIISSLETPPPSFPARLILKCGIRPWEDSNKGSGLSNLLKTESKREVPDWDSLAEKLSARPFGEYCISSDGEMPFIVSDEDAASLKQLTKAALDVSRERLLAQVTCADHGNATLKFLTWQFRRCPDEVVEWLIDCIKNRGLPIFAHPFVQHHSSWILIFQGLARIANGESNEKLILKMLLSTRVENWNWRVESACVAILLSRSDTAPQYLRRDDVEKIAERIVGDFRANLQTEYTTFYYAPFLMAGLLRWRIKEPLALLMGQDPIADSLAAVVEDVKLDMLNRRQATPAFQRRRDKYLPILSDLASELEGVGRNPDLLLNIYGDG